MAELGKTWERDDLGGGQFRQTLALKPIAFLKQGNYARILNNFLDGDINFPNVVNEAGFFAYITSQGDWRVHPTRDPQVWFSIGAPYVNPANPVRATLNPFTRSGNVLTSVNANFDCRIIHGGHYLKLEFPLKNGFVPPSSKVAFPIDSAGITRQGTQLLVNGVVIMNLTPPVVYDAANRLDVRPISVAFQTIGGNNYVVYTLPSMAGMTLPTVDPTLTLQPDATAGMDTFLENDVPTGNFGTSSALVIGEINNDSAVFRTLIKFDLSNIPANAVISSATLSLYCTAELSDNAGTFRVYRQKRAWVEAQATWNIYATGNNWATAGGFHANDCEQTDIGSRVLTATETLNEFKDFALTPTTKAALDLGNGWLIKPDSELNNTHFFSSSDEATAANRPKLVVVYSYAPLAVGQGSYALSGQAVGLRVSRQMAATQGNYTLSGQSVVMQFARKLAAAVGNYTLSGQNTVLTHGYQLLLAAGSYTLTGINATLGLARRLLAAVGLYTLTGNDVELRRHNPSAVAPGRKSVSSFGSGKASTQSGQSARPRIKRG